MLARTSHMYMCERLCNFSKSEDMENSMKSKLIRTAEHAHIGGAARFILSSPYYSVSPTWCHIVCMCAPYIVSVHSSPCVFTFYSTDLVLSLFYLCARKGLNTTTLCSRIYDEILWPSTAPSTAASLGFSSSDMYFL